MHRVRVIPLVLQFYVCDRDSLRYFLSNNNVAKRV